MGSKMFINNKKFTIYIFTPIKIKQKILVFQLLKKNIKAKNIQKKI